MSKPNVKKLTNEEMIKLPMSERQKILDAQVRQFAKDHPNYPDTDGCMSGESTCISMTVGKPTKMLKEYAEGWDGESCKCCGREQRLAWRVTDEIWEFVTAGSGYTTKAVCLECFLKLAERRFPGIELKHIKLYGIAKRLARVVI